MSAEIKSTWQELPPVMARKNCSICHGTGWELLTVGESPRARRCVCRSLDQIEKLRQRVCIRQRYEHCVLEGYVPQNLSQTRALAEAHRFSERYPEVSRGLFFSGPPGVGKTHLVVGIVRELVLRFHDDILFADFENILRFRLSRLAQDSGSDSEWERLKKVSLLVLDGFGWPLPRREGVLMIEDLLQTRWLLKKITLFTGDRVRCRALFVKGSRDQSNPSAAQLFLCSLSPRTLMRMLTNVKMIAMSGNDYRRRKFERGLLF